MKTYRVTVAQTVYDSYEVVALNEDEAKTFALEGNGRWLGESADGADQEVVEAVPIFTGASR